MSKSNLDTITLDGSPTYGSKLDKVISGFTKPAMGFLAAAPPILIHHPISFLVSAFILAGTAIGEKTSNKALKESCKSVFGTNHQNLYIIKKPDENITPTKPEHLAAAEQLKKNYTTAFLFESSFIFVLLGVTLGLNSVYSDSSKTKYDPASDPIHQFINNHQEIFLNVGAGLSLFVITSTSFYLTNIFKNAETAYRFHKVVKGDWVITDEPPKELVRESMSSIVKRKFGIFAPTTPAPSAIRAHPENSSLASVRVPRAFY